MTKLSLTPAQEAEAQLLAQRLQAAFADKALELARLLASKDNHQLLGATEFQLRDQLLELGSQVLHTVLDERKKGGTKVPALPVPTATRPRAVSATAAVPSRP